MGVDLKDPAAEIAGVREILENGVPYPGRLAALAQHIMKEMAAFRDMCSRPDPVYQRNVEAIQLLQAAGMGQVLGRPNCMVNMVEEVIAERDKLLAEQKRLLAACEDFDRILRERDEALELARKYLSACEQERDRALHVNRALSAELADARAGWNACSEALIEMECKHLASMQVRALRAEQRLERIRMATPKAASDLLRRIDAWEDGSDDDKALLICCSCGEHGMLREGCEPAPLCDACAQDAVGKIGAAAQLLASDNLVLAEGIRCFRDYAEADRRGSDKALAQQNLEVWWHTHGCVLFRDETRTRPTRNPFDEEELRKSAEASTNPVALEAFRSLRDQLASAQDVADRRYMSWLHISTHDPDRDGSPVLGLVQATSLRPCAVAPIYWSLSDSGWRQDSPYGPPCFPTHWVPLPRRSRPAGHPASIDVHDAADPART